MTPEQIINRVDELRSEKANWSSYFQDLAHFCIPRKAFITSKRTPGERLDFHRIFDSTAIMAVKTMASGFQSSLTNPSSQWFNLIITEEELMESKDVRIWLKEVEGEIFKTFNTSNFDQVMQEFYRMAGVFGTGVIFEEEDITERVHFTMIPMGEVFIEEDAKGRVVRVFREFEYSVQQAFRRWGNKAGEIVTKAIAEKKFATRATFIHAVFPRDERDVRKKDKTNMPFASTWLEKKKQHLIGEGGFMEFPYMAGRFTKETDSAWGYSPAMDVLADIFMVNEIARTIIRAGQKIVDPPFIVPSRGFILPLNFNPAAANYRNAQTSKDDFQVIETKGNIPLGFDLLDRYQRNIERGFFVQLFQALSQVTKQMTIPEVQERIREQLVLLGPVVGRFQQEVLDPIVTRTFFILQRNGFLPAIPPILQNREFKVKHISPLARAQRESEISALMRTLSIVGEVTAIVPNAIDKIDTDKVIDIVAEVTGTDPRILRDDREIAEIREARAQQAAQQEQIAQVEQVAEVARVASEADKNTRQ